MGPLAFRSCLKTLGALEPQLPLVKMPVGTPSLASKLKQLAVWDEVLPTLQPLRLSVIFEGFARLDGASSPTEIFDALKMLFRAWGRASPQIGESSWTDILDDLKMVGVTPEVSLSRTLGDYFIDDFFHTSVLSEETTNAWYSQAPELKGLLRSSVHTACF